LTDDVLGPEMKAQAAEQKLNVNRRTLIQGFKGDNVTVITPLLRFYIRHGLKVTKIYEAAQFTPRKCFEQKGRNVIEARKRAANGNNDDKIRGELEKLKGGT
jgi:hypothetical protein